MGKLIQIDEATTKFDWLEFGRLWIRTSITEPILRFIRITTSGYKKELVKCYTTG